MAVSGIEQARFKGMLESLQQQDPDINHIVAYSKFVVAYLLQQDGPNPGWRKANIEGPVYLVRRRSAPWYQLLVKNQLHTNDLLDNLHPDWELDCQKNYVFYKVEDPSKRIRGLWFHDDAERQRIEATLEKTLEEIRTAPAEPQTEPLPAPAPEPPRAGPAQHAPEPPVRAPPAPVPAPEPPQQAPAQDTVTVSMSTLRSALHSLAEDDAFCKAVMQKLKVAKSQ
uniref:Uncharacterized protein n=1 Tax=Pyrodinium bahamense TaxID=73915 RepID=A0A7R9ZZT7_9DINO